MPERFGQIRCQRCRAANALGQELCAKCGTRLMLIVEPSSLRFEEASSGGEALEHGHLLERVSILENQLGRVVERLEKSVELMLRQARAAHLDHMLLETLIDALAEAGAVNLSKLRRSWRELRDKDAEERARADRRAQLRAEVLAAYDGHGRGDFERLVGEGFELAARGDVKRGLRALERAAALAPNNAPLNYALGAHFFREGRAALARDYLERARSAGGASVPRAGLLLGILSGDEGAFGRAKDLLGHSVLRLGPTFAAHYALGRLRAAEGDWAGALEEFRRALRAKPAAEAHYCAGLACHFLGRARAARRHLSKALELDSQFAAAHLALGHVLLSLGETGLACESFASAGAAARKNSGGRPAARRGRKGGKIEPPPLRPFGLAPGARRKLVTGGDERLAVALQEDALGAEAGALTAAPRTL